jgi:autotransporter translocation and assembly factor TamB
VQPRRRSRRRRWIAVLLALTALASALSYSLWLPLAVETLGPSLARRFADCELELGAVERCDLGGLRLRGLRLRQLGPAPILVDLRAATLELEYGAALWRGELGALRSVRGSGLRLELDPRNTVEDEDEAPLDAALLPAELPRLDLRGLELLVHGDSGAFELREVSCASDGAGSLRVEARYQERALLLLGDWRARAVEDLELGVDGRALLRGSRLDLAEVLNGDLRADLRLSVGAAQNRIRAALAGGVLSWEAELVGLDLAALEAQLPLRLEAGLAGNLRLGSQGRLPLDELLAGRAQLAFELGPCGAFGWRLLGARGELRLEDSVLRVEGLEARQSESNELRVPSARLPLEGTGPANWLERAAGELSLEVRDLAALLEPAGLLGDEVPQLVEHHLSLRAELAQARLRIERGEFESAAGLVHLEAGEVWLSENGTGALALSVHGAADLPSLTSFAQLFGRSNWSGECRGRVDVSGTWPELRGGLVLSGTDLVLEGQEFGLLELELATAGALGRVELRRLHSESALGQLDARLSAELGEQPIAIELEELRLTRDGRGLALQESARIEVGAASATLSQLRLVGEAGEILLSGRWSPADFAFGIDVCALHPELFLDPGAADLPRFADATFSARGSLHADRLEFTTTGGIVGLTLPALPAPLDLQWNLEHDGEWLEIGRCEARGGERLSASLAGRLPLALAPAFALRDGPLELRVDAHLPLEVFVAQHAGDFALAAQLAGGWSALSGQIDLRGDDLYLPPEIQPAELGAGSLAGTFVLADGLRWDGLVLRFGDLLDARASGRLELPLDVQPWIDDPAVAARDARIDARVVLATLDVERLTPILSAYTEAAEGLRAGRVSGELGVSGPLNDPRFDGRLRIAEGRLRLGGGLPSVEELAAELGLANSRLAVERCSGSLGASPFGLSGSAELGGEAPRLDFALHGEDLLLFRSPSAKVRANTDLTISGPFDSLVVAGRIELTRGRYSPDTEFLDLRQGRRSSGVRGFQLFSLRNAPLRDMRFDVELVSREPFEIRNSMIRGSMRPDLHLGGSGLVPVLSGRVFLDQILLRLPATSLELTGGTVQFNAENPFIPLVDIAGRTRMLGYEVHASISGDYDVPEVHFSSTPPLSQEDLFLLVLTGRLPQDPAQRDALAAANTIALYLARDTLARWFADDGPVDEDSVLERLDFAFGQDVSKNGTETVDVAYRLTDKEGLPEERRNFRHLYLTAERDKFEDYNYGLRLVFRFRP